MYSIRRDPRGIRDGGARYGTRPVPAEPFEAAGVLDDLASAADEEVLLILARYAALRAWLLRRERAAPELVRHALSAAREHLAAAPAGWRERGPLRALLRGENAAVPARLEEAATLAEGAGHLCGARALRHAAQRARWPADAWSRPSRS
jgi:hypothetical protein